MSESTDVAGILRWEAPPDKVRSTGRTDWHPVAAELRSRPGRWAVVHETDSGSDAASRKGRGLSSSIATGNLTAFRPGGTFESVARVVGMRMIVFARFKATDEATR